MTNEELRSQLQAEDYTGNPRLYGLMPIEWADMEVHEQFPFGDILDEDGEIIRRKIYREYLIIVAETDTEVLARLCMKESDSNIHILLESPEMAATVALIGLENIYSHDGALAMRDIMCPNEGEI